MKCDSPNCEEKAKWGELSDWGDGGHPIYRNRCDEHYIGQRKCSRCSREYGKGGVEPRSMLIQDNVGIRGSLCCNVCAREIYLEREAEAIRHHEYEQMNAVRTA